MRESRRTLKWLVFAAAVGVGVLVGTLVAVLTTSRSARPATIVPSPTKPAASWAARTKPAPDFRLHDQTGRLVSLGSLRGRTVILTFIDPVCRNLCPLEAKILTSVEHRLPRAERPAIVSVSVNPWADKPTNFAADARKWHLSPAWRWALGTEKQLATVWRRYSVGVRVVTRTIAGVKLHTVEHTEASYLIDPTGYERALYLYPFAAADVAATARRRAASPS
jgi:cytochrome oxidase Cu insertion factor (SCO1/SenC/PrrC family)